MEKTSTVKKTENKRTKGLVAGIIVATTAIGVAAALLHHFLHKDEI